MAIVLGRKGGGSGGGGGGGSVSEITSDDNSITVTNPSGPTVDLSASGGSLPDGWVANDPAPTALNAGGGTLLNVGTLSAVSFQASPFAPGDTVFGAGDGKITGLAEGTDPTDAATVSQLGSSQTLADVVANGNDAGGQLKNLDDATDPQDAITLTQLQAFTPSLDDVLTVSNDAGGLLISNLAEGVDPSDAATVSQLGGGSVLSATVDLTAEDIKYLFTSPVEVIPAPGAGKVIVPVTATFQYLAGAEAFSQAGGDPGAGLFIVYTDGGLLIESQSPQFQNLVSQIAFMSWAGMVTLPPSNNLQAQEEIENIGVVVATDQNPGLGEILTSVVSVQDGGGAGWEAGDTFTIIQGGSNNDAAGEVDTVDGGGAVLTYHLTDPGTDYTQGNNNSLDPVVSATGTGGAIDILTVDAPGDGTGRITVLYHVMDLLA